MHGGTSLTQVYTLTGFGSENIGSANTYGLYTANESVKLYSDGAKYIILDHYTGTGEVSGGTITYTATATPPTKGTIVTDRMFWVRRENFARIYYEYAQSNAGTAGSGDYLMATPSGLTADTTNISLSTTTASNAARQYPVQGVFVANIAGGGGQSQLFAALYTSTTFRLNGLIGGSNNPFASSTALNLAVANLSWAGWLEIPISGWQP